MIFLGRETQIEWTSLCKMKKVGIKKKKLGIKRVNITRELKEKFNIYTINIENM